MRESKIIILSSIITSLLLVGCGDSNSTVSNEMNTTGESPRFTTMIMDTETLEIDNLKKVEWIGSAGKNGNACQPNFAATTEVADIEGAKTHCEQLVFGTHTDWRVATAIEHQEHIIAMKSAGKTPFYTNPACPRLIGVDNTEVKAVNTHNSTPIGAMTIWSDLINSTSSNYGVKCIRTMEDNSSMML